MSNSNQSLVERFGKALQTYTKSTAESMKYAHICICLALEHFGSCGDTSLLQEFRDAMPQNYGRRQAADVWMKTFGPITIDESRVKKNRDVAMPVLGDDGKPQRNEDGNLTGAVMIRLEEAKATKFWEFTPEAPVKNFGLQDFLKAVEGLVKRYEGEKMKAASPAANAEVVNLKEWVASRKTAPIPVPATSNDTPDNEAEEGDEENVPAEAAPAV